MHSRTQSQIPLASRLGAALLSGLLAGCGIPPGTYTKQVKAHAGWELKSARYVAGAKAVSLELRATAEGWEFDYDVPPGERFDIQLDWAKAPPKGFTGKADSFKSEIKRLLERSAPGDEISPSAYPEIAGRLTDSRVAKATGTLLESFLSPRAEKPSSFEIKSGIALPQFEALGGLLGSVADIAPGEERKETIAEGGKATTTQPAASGTVGFLFLPQLDDVKTHLYSSLYLSKPFHEVLDCPDFERVLNHFSLDLGVTVANLDKFEHPRAAGALGFTVGLGVDLGSGIRAGGGVLFYENQRDKEWDSAGYVTISLDLLGRVLGVDDKGARRTVSGESPK